MPHSEEVVLQWIKAEEDIEEIEGFRSASLQEICEEAMSGPHFGCGKAACGSCAIEIFKGSENLSCPTDQEKHFLGSQTDFSKIRLACQCRVNGEISFGPKDSLG